MKGKTKLLNQWASRLQVPAMLDQYWGKNRLTVLNYHRIADVNAPDFVGFAPNVSTDAQGFERQMQYVTSHFNVIALDDLVAYILHGTALPDKPLLITFDDGYLDNYQNRIETQIELKEYLYNFHHYVNVKLYKKFYDKTILDKYVNVDLKTIFNVFIRNCEINPNIELTDKLLTFFNNNQDWFY